MIASAGIVSQRLKSDFFADYSRDMESYRAFWMTVVARRILDDRRGAELTRLNFRDYCCVLSA